MCGSTPGRTREPLWHPSQSVLRRPPVTYTRGARLRLLDNRRKLYATAEERGRAEATATGRPSCPDGYSRCSSMFERPDGGVGFHHVPGRLPVRLPFVVAMRRSSPGLICHGRPVVLVEAWVVLETLR